MNKLFSLFLDRLAERFAALLAGMLSSRVEGLHAAAQADQQSQLEDLARKYDAEGKPEIAVNLRQRATRLSSTDLAAEAVAFVERLTAEPPRIMGSVASRISSDLSGTPDFSTSPGPRRNKRRKPADDTASSGDSGVTS